MRYSQAGKATVFGAVIRWFESSYRNYFLVETGDVFVSYKKIKPKWMVGRVADGASLLRK